MPTTLVPVPSSTVFINAAAPWSSVFLDNAWPLVMVLAGIGIAFVMLSLILSAFTRVFDWFGGIAGDKISRLFTKKYTIIGYGPRTYETPRRTRIVDRFSGELLDDYDELD